MKVRYTPRARDDLRAILAYIERRSQRGADNVARAMHKTIELIGQFPQCGRLAGEQGTRCSRSAATLNLIYWSVEGSDAWIVHIRHTARRPWNPDQERS